MNTEKLEKILGDFHEISGMTVCILDTKYRYILSASGNEIGYCQSIHRYFACLNACIKSDREWLMQVSNKKQTLSFVCPFGFFEAIAPIMKNGEILAYLFLGAGIDDIPENDERILQNTLKFVPSADEKHIRECIKAIPHHSHERLDAIVGLLGILADYIGQSGYLSEETQSLGLAVKKYIDDNLDKKITLSDISWNLHRSTVSLTEHFKAEFGITIMQYLLQKRMEKAERMLRYGKENVTDVALVCGFPDVEYLSRTFKKVHGIPPKKWRYLNSGEDKKS